MMDAECDRDGCLCWMLGACDVDTAPVSAPEPQVTAAPKVATLTAGTRRDGDDYTGVIRLGRQVLAECGHRHANRDVTTRSNGRSARDCADRLLRAAQRPAYADELVTEARNAWQGLERGPWVTTTGQVERAKTACAADADALAATIAQLRAALDGGDAR